jgi:hypothetical protein
VIYTNQSEAMLAKELLYNTILELELVDREEAAEKPMEYMESVVYDASYHRLSNKRFQLV